MIPQTVIVGAHLRLSTKGWPKGFLADVRAEFRHSNPDFYRKRNMGFKTFGTPREIKTYSKGPDGSLLLPRGAFRKFKRMAEAAGVPVRFIDATVRSDRVEFPRFCIDPKRPELQLYDFQREALAAILDRHQGIVRSPTGSGKTTIGLAAVHAIQQKTMVALRSKQLANQWKREAMKCLGLTSKEVVIMKGGKKGWKIGDRLTIALQQTLYRKGNRLAEVIAENKIGFFLVDEVQGAAARTFLEVADNFPAHYRIGLSADETRKDGKEFLTYDVFGDVIYEIERQELEERKIVHPVTVKVIVSDARAPFYVNADSGEKDWNELLESLTADAERNALVLEAFENAFRSAEVPAVIFSHRREHAAFLSRMIYDSGYPCGVMLGEQDKNDAVLFEESRDRLVNGELKVAAGTFEALGTGINMPAITTGICATPIGNNRQFFGQVRGRTCRLAPGKDSATIYYIWDRYIFPHSLKRLRKWNDERVLIQRTKGGEWIPAKDY